MSRIFSLQTEDRAHLMLKKLNLHQKSPLFSLLIAAPSAIVRGPQATNRCALRRAACDVKRAPYCVKRALSMFCLLISALSAIVRGPQATNRCSVRPLCLAQELYLFVQSGVES